MFHIIALNLFTVKCFNVFSFQTHCLVLLLSRYRHRTISIVQHSLLPVLCSLPLSLCKKESQLQSKKMDFSQEKSGKSQFF